MDMLTELSLFSGYGGFSLGLRLAGIQVRTVMYVEWERYPQEILKARIKDGFLDDAPIWGDISTLDGEQLRGLVDIITGGFPCQPHSVAGLKQGADDERNLWPETLRVVSEVGPRYVILENVPGLLSASADGGEPAYGGTVVGELASLGYSVHWRTIGADDVGAPHRRKRWWCIAVANASEPRIRGERGASGRGTGAQDVRQGEWPAGPAWPTPTGADINAAQRVGRWAQQGKHQRQTGLSGRTISCPIWPPGPSDADGWERVLRERPDLAPAIDKEVESQFRRMDDGRSHRVDELKALGNGVLPAVVAEFLRGIRGIR